MSVDQASQQAPESAGQDDDTLPQDGPEEDKGGSGILLEKIAKVLVFLAVLPLVPDDPLSSVLVHPVSTLMLADLALFRGYDRQWVSWMRFSPSLLRSVLMSEDGQFCSHNGVDWVQMRSVIDDALTARRHAAPAPSPCRQ